MAEQLGMNTSSVRSDLAALRAWSGVLDAVEKQLTIARWTASNPIAAGATPGALIIAPFSVPQLAGAQADLANAGDAISYLIAKLEQEIQQQEAVSDSMVPTDAGWFVVPISVRPPNADDNAGTVILGDVLLLWDVVSTGVNVIRETTIVLNDFGRNPPGWMNDFTSYTAKYGRRLLGLVPYVGFVASAGGTYLEWEENVEDGNDWGNVRNAIGTGLAGAEIATLAFPPASVVVAAVGLVWDVFDLVWDVGEDFFW